MGIAINPKKKCQLFEASRCQFGPLTAKLVTELNLDIKTLSLFCIKKIDTAPLSKNKYKKIQKNVDLFQLAHPQFLNVFMNDRPKKLAKTVCRM